MTTEDGQHRSERLEAALDKAGEAEADGRLEEAERLFRQALFLEAKLRGVSDALRYVHDAGPLYAGSRLAGSALPEGRKAVGL